MEEFLELRSINPQFELLNVIGCDYDPEEFLVVENSEILTRKVNELIQINRKQQKMIEYIENIMSKYK